VASAAALLLGALALAADGTAAMAVQELKAAYLSHLGKFTTWPRGTFADPSSPIVMGFLEYAPSDVANFLEKAVRDGLSIKERPVLVERIAYMPVSKQPQGIQRRDRFEAALRRCHLLFIPRQQSSRWHEIHELLGELPVATVSDLRGFADSGGHVELTHVPRGPRKITVGIQVNLAASRRSGLEFSSRLLSLNNVEVVGGTP
jgi:hypothetical protein